MAELAKIGALRLSKVRLQGAAFDWRTEVLRRPGSACIKTREGLRVPPFHHLVLTAAPS